MNNASALTIAAVLAAPATPVQGQGTLPDPTGTPGAIIPAVTQETIGSTICEGTCIKHRFGSASIKM
jgi:hypothetical protein